MLDTCRTKLLPRDYHALKNGRKKKKAEEREQQSCAYIPASNLMLRVLMQEEPPTISAQTAFIYFHTASQIPPFLFLPLASTSRLCFSFVSSRPLLVHPCPPLWLPPKLLLKQAFLTQMSSHLGFLTQLYSSLP